MDIKKEKKLLDLTRIPGLLGPPYLIDLQISPYKDFLQLDSTTKRRKYQGLEAVLRDSFPIKAIDGGASLEYISYEIEPSKYSIDECQRLGMTYAGILKIKCRLSIYQLGENTSPAGTPSQRHGMASPKSGVKDIREEDIYIGEVPLMTETGTFIINGAERGIVSQLHRSPGVCFESKILSLGKKTYSARIIPYRGVWLDFEFSADDALHVSIDRRRKMPVTTLLKAIGIDNEEILSLFYPVEDVEIKSSNLPKYLQNNILASRVIGTPKGMASPKDEKVVAEAGIEFTPELMKLLYENDVKKVKVIKGPVSDIAILQTLKKEKNTTAEEAILDVYRRLRPGERPIFENAKDFVGNMFFSAERYDLAQVGRYKINRRLKRDVPLEKTVLEKEDLIEAIRYLLTLRAGEGVIDDIDHLGNRRVRTVGELVREQFRIGFAYMRRAVRDRMAMVKPDEAMPHHLVNPKLVTATVRDFFARSQLSQFLDQVNPLAELTHKRRLNALGPGGLSRERAGFEVRDVHSTHYGRICPIETPEGPNIGLITSLSTYARINPLGFLETPYLLVKKGRVTKEIEYLSADVEDDFVIAQANARVDSHGNFLDKQVACRHRGEFPLVRPGEIDYMDVSPMQLVGVSASLIPFLEHDDANRALMGSNMQRQAVPLVRPEPPIVGTGMEKNAARDSGVVLIARRSGTVEEVSADEIVIKVGKQKGPLAGFGEVDRYILKKFQRSNQGTCINQRPIVTQGDKVKEGDIIADGAATYNGELSLGANVFVGFMPWEGYNFEDAILISEKLLKDDRFTSIHIEDFSIEARDTKLGKEEITSDIPNVSEEALKDLDEDGIVRIGAEVGPGSILIGKVTPKSETELSPEEKLLHAIFGEKAGDVRDASLVAPPGVEGIVIDTKVFSRKEREGGKLTRAEKKEIEHIKAGFRRRIGSLNSEKCEKIKEVILGKKLARSFRDVDGNIVLGAGSVINETNFKKIRRYKIDEIVMQEDGASINEKTRIIIENYAKEVQILKTEQEKVIARLKKGDELSPGVNKLVKVYITTKRRISVGDKMAGRHGNKGVIARILPEEDMPYLEDGTHLEIVLNPLGVPSRMNVGQVLETHLGWAMGQLGMKAVTPVFNGSTEQDIKNLLKKAGLSEKGTARVYDGRTGEPFDQEITVGYIYMMKLVHLVDEKIHARSIGPYSLVTQQPLGGKAQFGGQRFGEMEVWALEGYGAAYTLQELLTVKSDDVTGRTRVYEGIVKGEPALEPGTPESFNVLIKELHSLCLNVKLEKIYAEKKRAKSFDKFDVISISIASAQDIKAWSNGEVKKPETINYRTFKPERDGLFCERIFGPSRDWECYCGKYKSIKHKGIVCDRCGVEVIHSKVRRDRMGHIKLAAPVSHVWFFKSTPSRIGNLLDMSLRNLERVLYYEDYVVIDPGDTPLQKKQLLSDEEYQRCQEEYSNRFQARMGAEAIKELLKEIDLNKLYKELVKELELSPSKQKRLRLIKRLKIVDAFRQSRNESEWMILDTIPVLPPDLRPLVPLEGGRFATSDLNDLYRRVINRNNRLRRLLELSAPEIIIRNEKRMLQEAVDALFDNGRHGRPVLGAGNRPLKSLSDMLKGKQGRFRQNLLGKRVDYSGRSVIVIGPNLKLHQCGLPKQMALELFEPFIIKVLKERGYVHSIKSAKRMVEKVRPEVWDILDEVIKGHPVLLNRAPTLHRLGIQAFEPVLIEGKAIRIHPFVCTAFNADFDGDQMAVHVPLSIEAQMESRLLMMATNNLFSPANGQPITTPTQDLVIGCNYLTKEKRGVKGENKVFVDLDEVIMAYTMKAIDLHAIIKLRLGGKLIETTVGRVIFNDVLPEGIDFIDQEMDKDQLTRLIKKAYDVLGRDKCIELLDILKVIGFEYATRGGITAAIDHFTIPEEKKELIEEAKAEVLKVEEQYKHGLITSGERHNKIIDIWTHTNDTLTDILFGEGSKKKDEEKSFNPIFMMSESRARGSRDQIRQLAGMRGLIAKPTGDIIETPIIANLREGLTVQEYFISAHGARKGLADTALKTADAGYLTRRLVDVSQDVIIMMKDCGTVNGITITGIYEAEEAIEPLSERILGRTALEDVIIPLLGNVIVKGGEEIEEEAAALIEESGIEEIKIRSILTCEAKYGVCAKCYGRNLATQRSVDLGEAVGIIAAQSIGEPGTQLTMRTFHIGGIASRIVEESKIAAKNNGRVTYHGLRTVKNKNGQLVVLNRNGYITICDEKNKELEKHIIPSGSVIKTPNGEMVKEGEVFVEWDPYTSSIFTEAKGRIRYDDIIEGVTMREEVDRATGLATRVIIEHREDRHPQITIEDEKGEDIIYYSIPVGAHIVAKDKEKVAGGSLLAKTPRAMAKTRDITVGLPRVAELFEARRPKDPAIMSEIDGEVQFAGSAKGMRKILIKSESGMEKSYLIPHSRHLSVYKGDRVIAGQQLVEGPVVLQDVLRVSGDKRLQEYLLNEVQEVYRLQGIKINDKHIEVIIRQMLKKVLIEDVGDTSFLVGEQVDKFKYREENEKVVKAKKKPARATPILLGITKAALSTDSFISAASFQETTRVLTEAACSSRVDYLRGLKENVIMGHLILAGTGYPAYNEIEVKKENADNKSADS